MENPQNSAYRKLLLTDIDGTLLGGHEKELEAFRDWVHSQPDLAFGVVTGRGRESAFQGVADAGFDQVDVVICAVGTEIYYGHQDEPDHDWHQQLDAMWDQRRVNEALSGLPFAEQHNARFKMTLHGDSAPSYHAEVKARLAKHRLAANLIVSHDYYLDVLPHNVDKAQAVSHVAQKLGVGLGKVLVAGDSANDTSMLIMPGVNAVLVGNHLDEVKHLIEHPSVYAAEAHHAAGIMEGVHYYKFHK